MYIRGVRIDQFSFTERKQKNELKVQNKTQQLPGDLNGDKSADVTDLSLMSLIILGDESPFREYVEAGDFDNNGKLELSDLAHFRQYLSKKISALEYEDIEGEQRLVFPWRELVRSSLSSSYRPGETVTVKFKDITDSNAYGLVFNDSERFSFKGTSFSFVMPDKKLEITMKVGVTIYN